MKVKDLFEVVMRKPGDSYSDDELKAQQDARLKKKTTANGKLLNLIRTKCKNNFNALVTGAGTPLYRSTKTTDYTRLGDYLFADIVGRDEPRQSQTGSNLFLNYASQSPLWKGYPKREIANSCTPNLSAAKQFSGTLWLIIPYDNVGPLAKCKGDFNYIDIGDGSDGLMDKLGVIDDILGVINDATSGSGAGMFTAIAPILKQKIFNFDSELHRYTLEEITQLSDSIEQLIYKFDDASPKLYNFNKSLVALKESLDYFEDEFNTRSLEEWLKDKINPKNMKIKLFKSYLDLTIPKDSEVWFEGNYIAIAADPGGYESTDEIVKSGWLKDIAKQV